MTEKTETITTDIIDDTNDTNDTNETETQEVRGIKVKFEVSADESPLLDRLINTYLSSNRGKMVLLKESACGGFALKESGLLDLILSIASRDDYIEADSFGRTSIMIHCLRDIISPPQQVAFIQPPAPKPRGVASRKAKVEPVVEAPKVEPAVEPVVEAPKAEPVVEAPKKEIKVELDDLSGLGDMGA